MVPWLAKTAVVAIIVVDLLDVVILVTFVFPVFEKWRVVQILAHAHMYTNMRMRMCARAVFSNYYCTTPCTA